MSKTKENKYWYIGSSMSPTLKSGDRLCIDPCDKMSIRTGDILVYCPSGDKQPIVHRVVSIGSQSINTRGDNSPRIDSQMISFDEIVGKVTYVWRGRKILHIHSGSMGNLHALFLRLRRLVIKMVFTALHFPYSLLTRSNVLNRFVSGKVTLRVFSFTRPAGTELQLFFGRRLIGRLVSDEGEWWIRRPYQLFVDDASLPRCKLSGAAD
ncbi:signal peptidase I [Candidatus Pacearchaeota archaeon]|nr:signal peptidase I [Candidatus Pacearchaeota archaeon]